MIVCNCLAVSDRDVRSAVESGARTVEDITAECGAGGDCGGCRATLVRLVQRHRPAFQAVG
jgi:bacterioferritin-associated ferredoxin